MENDQRIFWLNRRFIACLFVISIVFGAGKVRGGEEKEGEFIPPINIYQVKPVVNSVMIGAKTRVGKVSTAQENQVAAGSKEKLIEEDKHRIKWGETFWSISKKYGLSISELSMLNPGIEPAKIKSGDFLRVKKASSPSRGRSSLRNQLAPVLKNMSFSFPVSSARLTSPFGMRWGRMHYGIDLAAPGGTPVRAVYPGKVDYAGWRSGYGLLVILDHGDFRTVYAHNSENLVQKGEIVTSGQTIAKVGRTGNATGNHLHFELDIQGQKINPLPYLY